MGRLGGPDEQDRPAGALVGDDLFVTNTAILKEGIDKGRQRHPHQGDQIGTLTRAETPSSWRPGRGYAAIVSHRSGETEDVTMPTWPWRRMLDRSRRLGVPDGPHRKYNSSSASRRTWPMRGISRETPRWPSSRVQER